MNLLKYKKLIKYKNKKLKYEFTGSDLIIKNETDKTGFLIIPKIYRFKSEKIVLEFKGEVLKGSAGELFAFNFRKENILISNLNSSSFTEDISGNIIFALKAPPFSTIRITEANLENKSKKIEDLIETDNDILVITPNYPTLENKYMCAFVHSRLMEYKKAGLKFDVICCHNYNGTTKYQYEDISIVRTSFYNTRDYLRTKKYKKILVHFFDEEYANIFDSLNLKETELMFWIHGPETLYWDWPKFTTPYFEKALNISEQQKQVFINNDKIIHRYNEMKNVKWIFVSNWIKSRSEKLINIKFKNYAIIPNIINDKIFAYKEKEPNLRKKIFFVRRFDDCNKYGIDINVKTILLLSKKPFFKNLEFNIYGTGNLYNELLDPIKDFENVNLFPEFLNHKQIAKIHSENGIAFFPTRYDAQGVSMCEAASSGLAVVTSDNPAIKEFLNKDINIFASTENEVEYAKIIEELYYNPEKFTNYSELCHKSIYEKCNFDKTISKEIQLIKKQPATFKNDRIVNNLAKPILSILIPSYNVESYLESCVTSILDIKNKNELEVIIVNDGSNDKTLQKAKELYKKYNVLKDFPIKIVDKKNGGHGSTINAALKVATGKYFRIIDADDWVNSSDFNKLVSLLKKEKSDIVITDYSEDLAHFNYLNKKEIYNFMIPGKQYIFEDLCLNFYGFKEWGPILATGNYKTEMLKKTSFTITEKSSYVDMEFNCYSIINANTITYYNLDIYRYFLGREDQSVSLQSFKNKYKQHENVLFNIIGVYYNNSELSNLKKKYILEKLIIPMVKSHYLILTEYRKSRKDYKKFDIKLKAYPEVYNNKNVKSNYINFSRKTYGIFITVTPLLKNVNKLLRKVKK